MRCNFPDLCLLFVSFNCLILFGCSEEFQVEEATETTKPNVVENSTPNQQQGDITSSKVPPNTKTISQTNTTSESTNNPAMLQLSSSDLTLTVVQKTDDGQPAVKNSKNPTGEQIRQAFDSLDWDDSEQFNAVTLMRTQSPQIVLSYNRELSGELVLRYGEQPNPTSQWSHKYSDSISKEQALKTMLELAGGNGDFRTSITWKEFTK